MILAITITITIIITITMTITITINTTINATINIHNTTNNNDKAGRGLGSRGRLPRSRRTGGRAAAGIEGAG